MLENCGTFYTGNVQYYKIKILLFQNSCHLNLYCSFDLTLTILKGCHFETVKFKIIRFFKKKNYKYSLTVSENFFLNILFVMKLNLVIVKNHKMAEKLDPAEKEAF